MTLAVRSLTIEQEAFFEAQLLPDNETLALGGLIVPVPIIDTVQATVDVYASPSDHIRVYGFNIPNIPKYTEPTIESVKPYGDHTRVILRRRRGFLDAQHIQ
jgi:hypothetical protein